MKFKKLVMTAVAGVMSLSMAAGVAQADTLRIAIEGAYPPFSAKAADGSLVGFDVDIALALCEQMGRECELIEQEWDGMIPALIARKFDAIVASMSITEDRKKKIDFSAKYYHAPARMAARKDAGLEPTQAGLSGKRIGVQRGTIHQCYVEKNFPDSEVVLYATQEDVYADMISGRIDVLSTDSIQLAEGFLNLDSGQDFAFLGGDEDDVACLGEGEAVAVRKGDPLADEFSAAIAAIRDNGVYKTINDNYFVVDIFGN